MPSMSIGEWLSVGIGTAIISAVAYWIGYRMSSR